LLFRLVERHIKLGVTIIHLQIFFFLSLIIKDYRKIQIKKSV